MVMPISGSNPPAAGSGYRKTARRNPSLTGSLIVFLIMGCLVLTGFSCSAGNLAAYFIFRRPVVIRDPIQIQAEMDQIGESVRDLRGIQNAQPVERFILTSEEYRARAGEEFLAGYSAEDARDEGEEFAAFGVLEPGTDLYQLYSDLMSDSIAGYYDMEDHKLYVVSGGGFGPAERITYAHEYMHALQFQREDIQSLGWTEEMIEEDSERAAAIQALLEGEASLVEEIWMQRNFAFDDTLDYLKQSLSTINATIFRLPQFLQRQVLFPYSEGKDFVAALRQQGGWAAVDAAYAHPPVSTEMILHPQKYFSGDLPVRLEKPRLPEALPGNWRELNDNTMGEMGISLLLQDSMPSLEASAAAAGWAGDRYVVWHEDSTGQTLVAWHTQWDTLYDATEFFNTLLSWNEARFGDAFNSPQMTCWQAEVAACQVDQEKDGIWWFYASDRNMVQMLVKENIPGPK